METLYGGLTLELCPGAFPLSTDSIALGNFVKLPKGAQVLDLGAGCGVLGLMLCGRYRDCQVTGFELDPAAHDMALKNSQANDLGSRLTSICGDLTNIPQVLKAGSFHVCVSNPPYFPSGPASKTVPLARRENSCSLKALFVSAAWALRYGGDFFLVHRPERLAEICACAADNHLEPKRLCLLRHRENGPVALILLQCRKGGKPGLTWEEASLYHPDGTATDYYRMLYHE